jgi:hypothetical protein
MTLANLQPNMTGCSAARLLDALTRAHDEVLGELAKMQATQELPQPRPEQWAYARWKLSRASRNRRNAVQDCYGVLLDNAAPGELASVRKLQSDDGRVLEVSRQHMSQWTPERIEQDWSGYCAASAKIRRGMQERIAEERRALIPILQRVSAAA